MAPKLRLPPSIVGWADVSRMLRELELLDETLSQAALRQPGSKMTLPRSSRNLDEMAEQNEINLLVAEDRQKLKSFLTDVKDNAPRLHISFAVDPSARFLDKLVTWIRAEIGPLVLITVGIQPVIGAGCIVRTSNKLFDLSLKEHFKNQRQLLLDKIGGKA